MISTPPADGLGGDADPVLSSGDGAGALSPAASAASAAPGGPGEDGPRLTDPVADASLEQLLDALEGLGAREPWRLSDDDLAAMVGHSEVGRRRLLMVQVAAAAEAGKRGLPRQAGFGPGRGVTGGDTAALAAWVRSLVNVSRGQARQVAEVGAALFTDPVAADLAETRTAAVSGQITARHVNVIAAAVAQLSPPLAPTDPVTGETAVDEDTRREAQRLLAAHASVLDPGAGERLAKDEDARDDQRGLSFTPDGDTQYAFPPKTRTAIITRDRGCTYPGCGAPAPWCDSTT
jgi:hypothetical protein